MTNVLLQDGSQLELVPMGKKLYLCRGFSKIREISNLIEKIEVLEKGSSRSFNVFSTDGIFGLICGLFIGFLISHDKTMQFRITLHNSEPETLVFKTDDTIMIDWLRKKARKLGV